MMIEVLPEERESYIKLCNLRIELYEEKARQFKAAGIATEEGIALGNASSIKMFLTMLKGGRKVLFDEQDLIILGYK